jgi:DNA-binding ferritin-like protein (Dps family)
MSGSESIFQHPEICPYMDSSYPILTASHDSLYYGNWRKMSSNILDVRKGMRELKRYLVKVKGTGWKENLQPFKLNLKKAFDSLENAEMEEDPFLAVRYMDMALSFAHHALNDLLHERGEKPHNPSDYEAFYDIIDLPFREEL